MTLRGTTIVLALLAGIVALIFFNFPKSTANLPSSTVAPATAVQLNVVAQVGPWPVASRLIGYRGRLWFANSVKGRNHNSADIWSLDPATGEKRYERSLFSQDAGVPLVFNGLLYWPFEDALLSLGNGVVEVTDGENWQPLLIPNAPIYHTSELMEWQGDLLAITGTRNAGVQMSADAGRSWTELYIHPTPRTHVSRLKEMTVFNGKMYASLKDTKVKRLAIWTGPGFKTVSDWPINRYFNGLVVHKKALFGIVGRGKEREIWRYDGARARKMDTAGPFVDLASDGEQLWVVLRNGQLWSSFEGNKWFRHADLENGRPVSIEVIAGGIYVAGAGDNGQGIVWGPRGHSIPLGPDPPGVIKQFTEGSSTTDWQRRGEELDLLLSKPSSYGSFGGDRLRTSVYQSVADGAPQGYFAQRLKAKIPDMKVAAFGGGSGLKAKDVARATLLWAMAHSGQKNVPVDFLKEGWTAPPNSYEKYLELELSALRAVAMTGQNDADTIDALVARLGFADDPQWLKSQLIGTLTAISGQHFGYDVKAWRHWARGRTRMNDNKKQNDR